MSKALIFTDGSSRGNPGLGGYGAIVCYKNEKGKMVRELGGFEKSTTNNRMEMTAVIEALVFAKESGADEILLFTDSEYVKKGATEWAYGWASNNWKTKANMPILNQDLWQKMLVLVGSLDVTFKVIPGHFGIAGNERCDVIATSFADSKPTPLFNGAFDDYKVSLEVDVSHGSLSQPKVMRSKSAKAYSYVSEVGGEVRVHKTWADCESRVKGKRGARYRKALSKNEELSLIDEFSKY